MVRSRPLALVIALQVACFSESSDGGDDAIAASDETTGADGSSSTSMTTSTTTTTASDATTSTSTTTAADSSSSDGDASSEGPAPCTDDERPAIEIEPSWGEGWEGPFVLLPPDAPGCGPALVDAAPATGFVSEGCACDCQPQCATTFGTTCGNGDTVVMSDGQCLGTNLDRVAFAGELADGSCMPAAASPTAGPGHRICETSAACVVIPEASMGPCIRNIGEHACPDGLVRTALQPRLEPQCSECPSCEPAAQMACENATLQAFTLGGCSGLSTPFEAGGCSVAAALSVALDVDVDCPRAEHDGVATYCCAM